MSIAVITSFNPQFDASGNPLNGGSITVYLAGTTTLVTLYSASDLSGSAAANPIVLDSAGRHGMLYFATAAYKLLVKNSGGSTIYMRDNIDPGIAIGTGDLAIADGGTGASSAGAALTNLGGATAAELADLAADVAALSGVLASSEKTHIATGTTAQRPASPADGDIRRNTTTARYEGVNNSLSYENFVTSGTIKADIQALTGPFTKQYLTSGTGATYTTPTDCTYIVVKMIGGGGGGGAAATNNGSDGGTTIFNSINANGGSGGVTGSSATGGIGGTGGTGSATIRLHGAGGGGRTTFNSTDDVISGIGGAGFLGLGAAVGVKGATAGLAGGTNTGAGGSGGVGTTVAGGGGGGGEYVEIVISSPAATYTYTVGAGGAGGAAGTQVGGAGGSGLIVVEEYYH